MAETPTLYMPDLALAWSPQQHRDHRTEVMEARSGREQRRAVYPTAGRRRYIVRSATIDDPEKRRALYDFFQIMRGRLTPFYFWEPSPATLRSFVTGQTYGTSGATDGWHATIPLKGPYYLGKTPASATYPATGGGPIYVNVAGSPLVLASSMSCPPRGNKYATFLFNGVNQYGNAGTAANTRIAGDQTWAAWVFLRPLDNGMTEWTIASNETVNASGASLYVDGNRKLRFSTSQAAAQTVSVATTGAIPLNTWTLVSMSRSGGLCTFYINGVADITTSSATNPVASTTSLFIGQRPALGATTYFHGMMNDLRVFNAALAASDVLAIYNDDPYYDIHTNLKGFWKITDGKTATTFADSSVSNYPATIVNPSDDRWVGGEDELSLTGSSSGALTLGWVQNARQRVTARFDIDDIPESFLQSGGVYPAFDIAVREVI